MRIKSHPEDFVVEEVVELPEFSPTGEYVNLQIRKKRTFYTGCDKPSRSYLLLSSSLRKLCKYTFKKDQPRKREK
jgi:hypothetical protein